MLINLKIENIIQNNIFTETNIIEWDEYKNSILYNISNIDFNKNIENYISKKKFLYVSRPRMRKILYDSIVLNNNIFIEVGYNSYLPKKKYNITHIDIYDFIEDVILILVEKQQNKNI